MPTPYARHAERLPRRHPLVVVGLVLAVLAFVVVFLGIGALIAVGMVGGIV